MTSKWSEVSLADIYDIRSGLSKPASAFGSGYPFLSFKEVFGNYFVPEELAQLVESSEKERESGSIKRGDVFLTRTSETMHELGMSSVALKDYENATFNGFTKRLRPKEGTSYEVHPEFVAYYFRSPRFRTSMLAFSTLSTRASLNNDMINRLTLPLPPIEEQKRIANILKSLDDKASVNTSANQTLEEMAQAIFKTWFVDFDPVEAKMNGEQPKGMDAATASLFPEKLVDTEVGEIPEGWKLLPVGELLDKTIGGDWGKEEPDEKHTEEVRIVRGTDIPKLHGGAIESVPVRYVESKKLKTRKLERGDIVIEVSGGSKDQPTGRSLFVSDNILKRLELPSEPASFCRRFKPKSYEIGLLLAVHFQLMYHAGKTWEYQNQSTGISNFQTKYFLEAEHIVIPSDDVLDAFVKQVSPMMDMIHSNQNIELAKLRDTLLPKLLLGEIELGDTANMKTEKAMESTE